LHLCLAHTLHNAIEIKSRLNELEKSIELLADRILKLELAISIMKTSEGNRRVG